MNGESFIAPTSEAKKGWAFVLTDEIYPPMWQNQFGPSSLIASKSLRNLLLNFQHSYIPFGLIVIKWNSAGWVII